MTVFAGRTTTGPDFFDGERHHDALERLAIDALAKGDFRAAFQYADRRCRILPVAGAKQYTLRGDALFRAGSADAALRDIERALEIAPDDVAANRRLMAWGDGDARLRAARKLLIHERDFTVLCEAIALLKPSGQLAFAKLECVGTTITGWVAWQGRVSVTLKDAEQSTIATIASDPKHPLAAAIDHAANISIDRLTKGGNATVYLWYGKRLICNLVMKASDGVVSAETPKRPPVSARTKSGSRQERPKAEKDVSSARLRRPSQVTVIVPVYDDFQATKRCLDSLLVVLASDKNVKAVLIDDVTPDPQISALLEKVSRVPGITLLKNSENLGFIGSVNRALLAIEDDDVILLNSDTIVPAGFVSKLANAVYSAPDIGTATPISNNGEFTSFPVPFEANPMPSVEDISIIDEIAGKVNPDLIVDLPNGIGFCLYITRRCLNAVGRLSDRYQRGYLEDVDFCLQARDHGFRNVAATSVFVGHVGSVSFGAEKRSLVVANLERLEARYPRYRAECAAFYKVNPLRPARGAIERLLPPDGDFVLLVTGAGVIETVVRDRAQQLMARGFRTLIATSTNQPGGPVASLVDPAGPAPQSLSYQISKGEELDALTSYLASAPVTRIELADPAGTPPALLDRLLSLGVTVDLLIADAGLACLKGTCIQSSGRPCASLFGRDFCGDCAASDSKTRELSPTWKAWQKQWLDVAGAANVINVPCPRSAPFATEILRRLAASKSQASYLTSKLRWPPPTHPDLHARDIPGPTDTFGILMVGENAVDYQLTQEIARRFRWSLPETPIVVIAQTIDDLALMKLENVFVTGPVEASEYDRIFDQYRLKALFVARRAPLFGHPAIEGLFTIDRLPLAFIDWSFGEAITHAQHLAIDIQTPDGDIADELLDWFVDLQETA